MKKLFVPFALSVMACSLAVAAPQDQAPPQDQAAPQGGQRGQWHQNPDEQAAHLAKHLNLSDDQRNQIKGILANSEQQMQAVRGDSSLSQQDRRSKMMDLRQQTDTQVKGVLNADQAAKYDQMMSKRRDMMMQRRQQNQQNEAPPQQ